LKMNSELARLSTDKGRQKMEKRTRRGKWQTR